LHNISVIIVVVVVVVVVVIIIIIIIIIIYYYYYTCSPPGVTLVNLQLQMLTTIIFEDRYLRQCPSTDGIRDYTDLTDWVMDE